jgi:hypothetical protein
MLALDADWFWRGAAAKRKGESLVQIRHCPATVERWERGRSVQLDPFSRFVQLN